MKVKFLFIPIVIVFVFFAEISYSISWLSNIEKRPLTDTDLTELSLEDLMNIEITSVSKKSQKLSEAAAAIFVITQDDIRQSGVTSIPEALRLVPGIHVTRINASKWAITDRGFNGQFANKLLVLMDGRTIYDPLFSGVYWDVQDTVLEDIERIEVIRGPGATLWGANAVNGVINIITKDACNTQGGLISAGMGTEDREFCSLRYGDKFGDKTAYRIYAKTFERDKAEDDEGNPTSDDWRMIRFGFRADGEASNRGYYTLQGDIYDGKIGQSVSLPILTPPFQETLTDDFPVFGANLLTRWQQELSNESDLTLQFYYDHTEREETVGSIERDTIDIDLQYRFNLVKRQEIICGLGYRYTTDKINTDFPMIFDPNKRDDNLVSGFVQDDITLVPDVLSLILGSKFEYNDYTGFEIQPNSRFRWTPRDNHTLWAAVSRAVRTPSRYEDDATLTLISSIDVPSSSTTIEAIVNGFGNSSVKAEDLLALELGYRFYPNERLSFDLATFYNFYNNLIAFEFKGISPGPLPIIPFIITNDADAETYGIEIAADWQALDWWRFQTAYTFFKMDFDMPDGSVSTTGTEADSPNHQVSLRSDMELPKNLELNLWFRYIDNIPGRNISAYNTMDICLGWKPIEYIEFSLVGQNLFAPRHLEFVDNIFFNEAAELERSLYGKVTWKF
ncbi:MAG: TonB-dependent receptor [Desulfobacterales bacterium]|nr:TonB-dependent receptor [Desulfobacterales bacterium]